MNIDNPKELLKYMESINYGYLTKSGKIYRENDSNFNDDWFNNYILSSSSDIEKNKIGNCWDQVEFEREWFSKNNYEVKTFFEIVDLPYNNNYPTHSFLCYKENDKWNWFEHADYLNRGIHEFSSLEELLKYQYLKYIDTLKKYNINDLELNEIKIYEFIKPNKHITAKEYLEFVQKGEEVI